MSFVGAIHSEFIKVKHTPFQAVHLCLPLMGALLFTAYYILYGNTADMKKLRLILEITATLFPLLISIVVSLNIMQEEKTSHFQTLLAVPDRRRIIFSKLLVLYGTGVLALFCLFVPFVLGITVLGMAETIQVPILIQAAAGIALTNLIIYILHLFLSLKFGMGISLFWGVFESLQCILYSNVELNGIGRYIPFAWSMNWIQDIIKGNFTAHTKEWIWVAVFTTGGLLLTLLWFSHWEGRKNYE